MAHVNPPYRCDVVGSFLRPKTIAQARVRFTCGQISKEELTAIEDTEIKKRLPMHSYCINLLYTAIAGTHTSCHNEQCRFHSEPPEMILPSNPCT